MMHHSFSLFEKEETLDVSWWVHLQQAASLMSASITNKHPEIHRRHKEKLLTAPEPARESSRLLQYETNPVISVCTCTAAPQTGTAVNWFCILLMVQIKSCCTVQKDCRWNHGTTRWKQTWCTALKSSLDVNLYYFEPVETVSLICMSMYVLFSSFCNCKNQKPTKTDVVQRTKIS